MELRSKRKRNEYEELQLTLTDMGLYEEGMQLQEMREIINALELSVNDEGNDFLESDIQQAIKESELDFRPNRDSSVLNSTMMSEDSINSPCSSPEIPPRKIIVKAIVHHPMDWSPPHILTMTEPPHVMPQIKINDNLLSPDIESYCDDNNSSAINITNKSVNSNTFEISANSMKSGNDNKSEISNFSSHIIVGPVSLRKTNDSGLNTTYDMPTSFSPNSSKNEKNDSNNENCVEIPYTNEHEIVGPVSVRRINDSGVNTSNDVMQSSANNISNDETNNSLEISTEGSLNVSSSNNVFSPH